MMQTSSASVTADSSGYTPYGSVSSTQGEESSIEECIYVPRFRHGTDGDITEHSIIGEGSFGQVSHINYRHSAFGCLVHTGVSISLSCTDRCLYQNLLLHSESHVFTQLPLKIFNFRDARIGVLTMADVHAASVRASVCLGLSTLVQSRSSSCSFCVTGHCRTYNSKHIEGFQGCHSGACVSHCHHSSSLAQERRA